MEKSSPISPAQWQELEKILDAALEMPAGKRTLFLKDAASKNPSLQTLLLGLWEAGKSATAVLQADIPEEVVSAVEQIQEEEAFGPAPLKGMRIGDFKVAGEIGRGGMSIVYKAERVDGFFDQTVAMKILKRGMDTDQIVRRFLAERQILAGLQHPHIAQLLDGGATPDGRPYLVMEYVEGEMITKYCRQKNSTLQERLALFKQVGNAVEFAHRNLIVHRDLKANNILVTPSGNVKLLDFGIAKVLSQEEGEQNMTRIGGRVMTPEYAAPEQIFGEAITTATDVYALGVLLYELLYEQLPLSFETRTLQGITAAMRAHEPVAPSPTLDSESSARLAASMQSSPAALKQALSGDLDLILLKAMHKDPERRYRSVPELLDEIDRYQQGLPIIARPDSFTYRAKKFYRRNRIGVLTGSFAMVLLLGSFVATIWQARVAAAERDIAQREATRSVRVSEFLVDVFESIDPDVSLGDTLTAYEILERGAGRVEVELQEEPALQANMMALIGRMYHRLGAYEDAERWLQRAYTQQQRLETPEDLDMLDVQYNLASLMHDQGNYEQAESTLALLLTSAGNKPLPAYETRYFAGQDLMGAVMTSNGQYEEAQTFYKELLATQGLRDKADQMDVASMYINMAQVSGYLSAFDDAERYFEQALAIYRENPDRRSTDVARVMKEMSISLRSRGQAEAAAQAMKEALGIWEDLVGKRHPQYIDALAIYGIILADLGQHEASDATLQEALAIQEEHIGAKHPAMIQLLGNLGYNFALLEDNIRALDYFERTNALREELLGPDHPTLAIGLSSMGVAHRGLGNFEEAERLHRASMEGARTGYGEDHFAVGLQAAHLALDLHLQQRNDEALEYLAIGETLIPPKLGMDHIFMATLHTNKGLVLMEKGRFNEAEESFARAIEIYLATGMEEDHITVMYPKLGLGRLYLKQERFDEALPLLKTALNVRREEMPVPSDWRIAEAETALARYHIAQGNAEEAKPLLESALKAFEKTLGSGEQQTRDARRLLQGL